MTNELHDDLREEYRYPTMFGEAEVFTLIDENEDADETEDGTEGIGGSAPSNDANGNPSGTPIRVLYVGGGFQSATFLGERRFEPVFAYYRAFDHMFESPHTIRNVLMIGGGAYSYPKHLLTTHADVAIDVVEIDPAIVDIARKHFYLDELERVYGENKVNSADGAPCRLRTFVADGVTFLEKAAQQRMASESQLYDALINDSFDGTNPTGALLSQASIQNAKACLAPGGLYLLNVVTDDEDTAAGNALLHEAMYALADHFAYVYEIPCIDLEYSGADNYLVIATDVPCAFSGCTSALMA